ncbi:MAG: hypothetical protein NT062_12845 [Proteobacteria bacterium]|nr:hypothetical protein [Pseudomonadota bacterium]
MRALFVGALGLLVASSTLVACKGDAAGGGAGPAVVAGAAAGKVVEVTGKVVATRAGVARDLGVGDAVSGDDVIATSAYGKVAIDLAHNHARWNLGANKTSKVSESAAWSLALADVPAGATTGDTSAAGRHAERSAVDTAATAKLDNAPGATVPPTTTPEPPPPPVGGEAQPPPKPPKPIPAKVPLRVPATPTPEHQGAVGDKSRGGTREVLPVETNTRGDDQSETKEERMTPHPILSPKVEKPADDGGAPAVIGGDAAMRACLGSVAASTLRVTCTAGRCELVSATDVDAKAKACLTARLGKLGLTGTFTSSIKLVR